MTAHAASLATWAALASAALLCEAVALVQPEWPTIGDLVRWLMRPVVGRWVLLVAWVWLGWHTLVR